MSFVGLTRAFIVAQKTNPLPFLFRMSRPEGGLLRIENPSASSVRLAYGDDVTDVEAGDVAVLDIRTALVSITATLPAGANASTAQLPVVVGFDDGFYDQTAPAADYSLVPGLSNILFIPRPAPIAGRTSVDLGDDRSASFALIGDAEICLRGGKAGAESSLRLKVEQDVVGGHALTIVSAGAIVGTIPAIGTEPGTQMYVVFSTSDGGNTITVGN